MDDDDAAGGDGAGHVGGRVKGHGVLSEEEGGMEIWLDDCHGMAMAIVVVRWPMLMVEAMVMARMVMAMLIEVMIVVMLMVIVIGMVVVNVV